MKISNKFVIIIGTILAALLSCTWASLQNFNDHHSQHIDLGTFVGKHELPPKIIRITKTVAVKVPVPYPVKVPYTVPYPVPYGKPYPVHVPKYIKIKEQVPIEVPVVQHNQQHHENQYVEQRNNNNAQNGYDTHAGRDYVSNEQQQNFANNEFGHHSEQIGAYSQQQQQQQLQQQQQQQQYEYQPQQFEQPQQQQYNPESFQQVAVAVNEQHDYNNPQGDYSAQQLIYSNPRFGINAYYSRTNAPTGKQTSSSKYESHQEKMNKQNTNYMPLKMTTMYSKGGDTTVETHFNQQKEYSSYHQQPVAAHYKGQQQQLENQMERHINVVEQEFPPYDKQQQMNYAGHSQAEDQRLQHDNLRNYANL